MKLLRIFAGAVLLLALSPSAFAQPAGFAEDVARLFKVKPDIASCRPGELADAETQRVLATINEIRALHKLPAVRYDADANGEVMQTALVLAVSGKLDHFPRPDWPCYSAAAAAGAKSSNLNGGLTSRYLRFETSEEIVAGFLTDVRNAVPNSIGHRRWLLDPFLTRIAFGRVAAIDADGKRTDASSLKIMFATPEPSPSIAADYIAYPSGDYPARFWKEGAIFSFGAIINKTDFWANQAVDYSKATVTITQRGGGRLKVKDVRFDTSAFGLPNNFQFRTDPITPDAVYDVKIEGVRLGKTQTSYAWWFRIV